MTKALLSFAYRMVGPIGSTLFSKGFRVRVMGKERLAFNDKAIHNSRAEISPTINNRVGPI